MVTSYTDIFPPFQIIVHILYFSKSNFVNFDEVYRKNVDTFL